MNAGTEVERRCEIFEFFPKVTVAKDYEIPSWRQLRRKLESDRRGFSFR